MTDEDFDAEMEILSERLNAEDEDFDAAMEILSEQLNAEMEILTAWLDAEMEPFMHDTTDDMQGTS